MSDENSFFNVVNSNDISVLAALCARIIRAKPLKSPFDREKILIMNNGMTHFLEQEIAKHNSIHIQCDYYEVWTFIWEIYKKVTKNDNSRNLYSRQQLTWNILGLKEIWNDREKEPLLEKMRQYVEKDIDGRMSFELANEISDTFDQYQIYRPHWIVKWQKFTDADFDNYRHGYDNPIDAWINSIAKNNDKVKEILKSNVWQIRLWSLLKTNFSLLVDIEKGRAINNEAKGYLRDILLKSRSEVIDSLIYKLKKEKDEYEEEALKKLLPERVFIFGVSSFAPKVFEFLDAISKYIEVYYLFLNPCKEYWCDLKKDKFTKFSDFSNTIQKGYKRSCIEHNLYDLDDSLNISNASESQNSINFDKSKKFINNEDFKIPKESSFDNEGTLTSGNSLLLSLGKQGSDNLFILLNDLEQEPNFIDAFVDICEDDKPKNLLQFIKKQMLTLESEFNGKYQIQNNDNSIVIHSCHTKRREVEVLRDAILQKFKEAKLQNKKLLPRDIIVMVPTINEYAPYISAVFGSINKNDESYIPYAITDKTIVSTNVVAEAIITLLSIAELKVTNNLIIDLLSIPSISKHFNMEASDIDVISKWLKDCNVHWGIDSFDCKNELLFDEDESFKDSIADNEYDLPFTFKNGLERMLLGYMLGNNNFTNSYNEIDGNDSKILGNFCDFIDKLSVVRRVFTPHLKIDVDNWKEKLEDIIIRPFFDDDDEARNARILVSDVIDDLRHQSLEQKITPNITLLLFKTTLAHSLSSQRDHREFLHDNVNFCSLIPMRAVPFEHIFILGLNDSAFPRKDTSPAFNLMTDPSLYQRGDRSNINDDKYLFLEAILSAKESINFSYIGESPIDKNEQNPSLVLTELINYIAANCEVLDEHNNVLNKDHSQMLISGNENIANTLNALYKEYENIKDDDSSLKTFKDNLKKNYKFSLDSIDTIKTRLVVKETLSAFDPRNYMENNKGYGRLLSFNKSNFIKHTTKTLSNENILGSYAHYVDNETLKEIASKVLDINNFIDKLNSLNSKVFMSEVFKFSLTEYQNNILDEDEDFIFDDYKVSTILSLIEKEHKDDISFIIQDENKLNKLFATYEDKGVIPYGIFRHVAQRKILQKIRVLTKKLDSIKDKLQIKDVNIFNLGELISLSKKLTKDKRSFDITLSYPYLDGESINLRITIDGMFINNNVTIDFFRNNTFLYVSAFIKAYFYYLLNNENEIIYYVIDKKGDISQISIKDGMVSNNKKSASTSSKSTSKTTKETNVDADAVFNNILTLYFTAHKRAIPFTLDMLKTKEKEQSFLQKDYMEFLFSSFENVKDDDLYKEYIKDIQDKVDLNPLYQYINLF